MYIGETLTFSEITLIFARKGHDYLKPADRVDISGRQE
jgi:hypothetical protein